MAINFTDFSKIPVQKPWYDDIVGTLSRGFQAGQLPQQMARQREKEELANSLSRLDLEHKPKEYELLDSLREAKRQAALRPPELKGALAQAFQLKNQYPVGSDEYNAANNYITKLTTRGDGISVSSNPEGGFSVNIGGQDQGAMIPGFPKLKAGETPLYDDSGKPIGIGKPLTQADVKEISGRQFFNNLQPFLNKAQSYYSGKGANDRFEEDIRSYATDPDAKERIDNLLAAQKLLFSGTVKENATIGGANTNKVYDRLVKSLQSSEVLPILQSLSSYQLPAGYAQASSELFKQKLDEATQAGQNLPAYKPYYFNQNKKSSSSSNDNKKAADADREKARKYYMSLSPEQKEEYKRKHLGAK